MYRPLTTNVKSRERNKRPVKVKWGKCTDHQQPRDRSSTAKGDEKNAMIREKHVQPQGDEKNAMMREPEGIL